MRLKQDVSLIDLDVLVLRLSLSVLIKEDSKSGRALIYKKLSKNLLKYKIFLITRINFIVELFSLQKPKKLVSGT